MSAERIRLSRVQRIEVIIPSTTRSAFGKAQRPRSVFADTPIPSSSSAPKSSCCRRAECSLRIGAAARW